MDDYEQLCQWRDICEYLDKRWYKFSENDDGRFTLLLPESQAIRQKLWSKYMIQVVRWGQHPYNYYHSDREYRKVYGWRLNLGWEVKIDFLEQVTLFNRNPEDLPQPWRRDIWEAVLNRQSRIAQVQQERVERQQRIKQRQEEELKAGGCPINFDCRSMSGAFVAGECLNFEECLKFWQTL